MHGGGEGDQDNEREELHEQEDNRQQVFLPLHQLPCMEVERESKYKKVGTWWLTVNL